MLEAKKINLGILAHVDAGKTTLAEAILYRTGAIARAGRVDHQDAFLDTDETERRRGITIFSKMAQFELGERQMTLVDTPGHEDFGAEMERTLSVLDYALLLISGPDGIQGHTLTLWNLLRRYQIPTVLFINKMDLPGKSPDEIMGELQEQFSGGCCRFGEDILEERILEEAALADEDLLEDYLAGKMPGVDDLRSLVIDRKLFPCWFGSALKMEGVDTLLEGLSQLIGTPLYPEEFAARVFKVTRDTQKNRMTWLKITGGELKVRQEINGEKIDQIRIWSGDAYRQVPSAGAGEICAVTGLSARLAGAGLGAEKEEIIPILEPVTTCQVLLPEEADVHETYLKLMALEEEFPEIHLKWNREAGRIGIQLMGEVQTQILQEMIRSRVRDEETGQEVMKVEHFSPSQKIKVYVMEVKDLPKGPRIILSRTHPELVKKLFENEVTQIGDGTVEIKAIAREAGSRTKMAVCSYDPDVDPVGACVGKNGARVDAVVRELGGEKIDIIEWDENPALLIENALSPAKVICVIGDIDNKTATVVVPDEKLSLAIGKEGQNARLAARLTGFKIDIKSETKAVEDGTLDEYMNAYYDDEEYDEYDEYEEYPEDYEEYESAGDEYEADPGDDELPEE